MLPEVVPSSVKVMTPVNSPVVAPVSVNDTVIPLGEVGEVIFTDRGSAAPDTSAVVSEMVINALSVVLYVV